jgi:oligopeptide transport system ATP-binding protein
MYYGKIVELAESEELFAHPMHPYTRSLLSSIPQPDPDYEKGRKRIDYNPRQHDYRTDKPSLREIAPGHLVYANEAEFINLKKEYAEQTKKLNEKAQQAKVAEPKAKTTTKAKGKATTANKGGKK